MAMLEEPVPPETARRLRRAVLDLAVSDHRRRIPPVLHVGTPGGPAYAVADERGWDPGLRTDLVGAVLRRLGTGSATAWITRSGPLRIQDVDVDWLGPVVRAAAERRADVTYVVVTRHGWFDPRSGAHREWRRIRPRSGRDVPPMTDRDRL